MVNIQIAGHQNPSCYAALSMKPKELDTIVITNPNWLVPECVKELAKDYLHLEFNDVSTVVLETHPHNRENYPPKLEHVKKALEWSKDKDNILVCCHAGISRSSATALLIAVREWGLKEAFHILTPGWHHPNRLILKIGSEILAQPIYESYMKWRKKVGYD